MNDNNSVRKKAGNSEIYLNLFSLLLFLFFIQQITFLVESIYMLNLLHTSMDARALGLLLLALPVLLIFIKPNKFSYIIVGGLMLICALLSPILPTHVRIFSSGLGAGLFLLYLGLQFSDKNIQKTNWGQAAALATLALISFRAVGHTLDISISGNTQFIGWFLVLAGVYLFYRIIKEYPQNENSQSRGKDVRQDSGSWLNILGLVGSILLIYFAFSSPGVIARWTEGNYLLINIILSISIWIFMAFGSSKILTHARLKELLLITNTIFVLLLLGSILLQRVSFPTSPQSAPVIVGEANLFSQLITYFMLFLLPVLFINIAVFSQNIKPTNPSKLAGPFLLAVVLIIVTVFMLIFTNVWGYTKPVSTWFRNQFHLPFMLAGLFIILPYLFLNRNKFSRNTNYSVPGWSKIIYLFLVILCCSAVLKGNKKQAGIQNITKNELTVMTYNIQQGVDLFGDKNYEGQLEIIKEINPDVIGLQESDGSRISGGNSDVVRYFAENLGFYSYFGPKTVTGTFGTAILSRFPLNLSRTVFTYSNKDEIGTAVSEITVANQNITIVNSHPAGNKQAREAHIDVVAQLAKENKMVIALGDYNFREGSVYYKKITAVLNNAWLTLYPDAIGPVDTDKVDLSFKKRKSSGGELLPGGKQDMTERIDHIFISRDFKVVEAHYLPAPESGTDHPVHWAVVSW
jgi:endonuclease/exonuclease/phosphatase family metal-dependent hydrolase